MPAAAHDARPASVHIRELPGERFAVRVRTPDSVAIDNLPRLVPPSNCSTLELAGASALGEEGDGVLSCEGGVEDARFELIYPIYNPSLPTLYRLDRLDAPSLSALVPPSESGWTVPREAGALEVMRDYFRLGVEHIFAGLDHLLFVAGLLLIAGTLRRSLIALTGFTLAHSITLALSALDVVRIAGPPVEAAIALSILFLAVEIVRRRKDSLAYRYPALVASVFGLLHGFGFAGVLREIGIPQSEILAALLSFNLGVEAGQVLFVGLLLALYALLRRLHTHVALVNGVFSKPVFNSLAAYTMGAVSVFWLIERVASFA